MWKAKWSGVAAVDRALAPAADYNYDFFSDLMRRVESELVGYVKLALMSRPGGGGTVAEYVEGASEGVGSNSFRGLDGLMAGYRLLAPYPERDQGGGRHWFVEAGQKSPDRTGRTYRDRFEGTPFYDDTFSFGAMLLEDEFDNVIDRLFR